MQSGESMKLILLLLGINCIALTGMAQGSSLVLDSTHSFEYSSETDSTHLWKHEYGYDELGNLSREISYSWESFSERWAGNYWKIYAYDANGYKILEEQRDWNESNEEWNNNSKKEWAFETDGSPLMEAHYYWEEGKEQWTGEIKYTHAYNCSGQDINGGVYQWDPDTNDWFQVQDYEKSYDSYGNIIRIIHYQYDTLSQVLVADILEEYSYDTLGNQLLWISYIARSGQWINSRRGDFSYDTSGYKVRELYAEWDEDLSTWKETNKTEFTNDTAGRMTSASHYNWSEDVNDWIADERTEHSFDASGNDTLIVHYAWDTGSDNWIPTYKYAMSYGPPGPGHYSSYIWNSTSDSWDGIMRSDTEYNSEGQVLEQMVYDWDTDLADWHRKERFENIWDADGNRIRHVSYGDWDPDAAEWLTKRKSDFFFDSEGYELLNIHADWDSLLGDFIIFQKKYFYWSSNTTSAEEGIQVPDISVFPNPVRDVLQISSDQEVLEISVWDLSGKCLLISSQRSLDLSAFRSGLYILRIADRQGTRLLTEKVLKY